MVPHPQLVDSIAKGNVHQCLPESAWATDLAAKYEAAKKITGVESTANVVFDPAKHLQFYADGPISKHKFNNTRRLTMEELGLTHKHQISPIGVSDPFPLFTDEAIALMRQEILQKDLFLKYSRYCYSSTSGLDSVMRGYVKNDDVIDAPFTYQAWKHPKTMELVSKMAGVELEVIMDYEIAHVNVSMKDPAHAAEERIVHAQAASKGDSNGNDIPAVVGWHHDSYPFVCVLMLSDTTEMIGGETSLRMGPSGSGQVAIVPGPQAGYAAVLQGRLIEHIAPSPIGISERITMVTSYKAKDCMKKDTSVLSTVKPEVNYGSIYNSFYSQWVDYRVKTLKDRLDVINSGCRDKDGNFQKQETIELLKETAEYLQSTWKEMEVSPSEWEKIEQAIRPKSG
ncbi:uncharacterized protein CANTADRAFT_6401 [Suhomyces tanzawaensis NRRL Y-17324]|uniref:Fe2OG dioxygenase domain-containing protein n=1 Tax=Suhomyces tanzawaensis NRRL Y-17324 TaxID=984487 RepID=A0A1E4SIA3_9ASCO|nr:uncharacterized protein CANTADRAFT_6401 [Suhomyces tanzawaensis NRRL Y-17324]ODV79244.1 hypothetical protein CANTADRAFT_6401 [Suhomyces tanzawaensis NRRL Y-17324]